MGTLRINSPGKKAYVSTEVAAKWLDISPTTFRSLLAQERYNWIRPTKFGRAVRYSTLDIAVMAYVLSQAGGYGETSPGKKDEEFEKEI